MDLQINASEEVVTVYLSGELDHHNAKDVREQIDRSLESNTPKLLILDFKNVGFMDSSGIGLVMGRYKLMQVFGGAVKVVNAPAYIKKVMKLSGLDRLAEIG